MIATAEDAVKRQMQEELGEDEVPKNVLFQLRQKYGLVAPQLTAEEQRAAKG